MTIDFRYTIKYFNILIEKLPTYEGLCIKFLSIFTHQIKEVSKYINSSEKVKIKIKKFNSK